MIELINAVLIIVSIILVYFVTLELVRRHKCKLGFHSGHIKDGKLICHTCFKEIN